MYMCIRRPSFTGNPEWSDFSPVLMATDWSIYRKSNKSQLQDSWCKCAGWLLPLMPSGLHTGFLDSWQTGSLISSQTKWQGSRELLKSTTKAYRPSRGRITPIVSTKGNSSSISCLWIKSHSGDCFGWLYSYESWAFTFFQPLLLCCVWRKWQGYERAAQLPYSKVLNVQNESISEKCVIKKIRNSQVTSHMETLAALKYLRHSPRPSSLDPCLSVLRWRTFCCVSSIVILCPKWEAYGEVSGAEVSSQVIVLGSAPWLGFLVGLRWMKVIPLTCVITQIIHFPQRRH